MAHSQTKKKRWSKLFGRKESHKEELPQIDGPSPLPAPTPEIGDTPSLSPNGCRVARRISRSDSEARCRPPSNCIAAIDFGTTNCSVAYNIIPPGKTFEIAPILLQFPDTLRRVPTAILFDKDGAVQSFGEEARTDYYEIEAEEIRKCAYFEQIKMDLQHDEVRHDLVCANYHGETIIYS